MSDERVRVGAGGWVHVDGEPLAMPWWRDPDGIARLASLLRAGLAAEEAPEGLWPGLVVDGRQTYYCDSTEVPYKWDRRWSRLRDWDDDYPHMVRVVQCRPPAPQPVTERVRLDQVIGRVLVGETAHIVAVTTMMEDGEWTWLGSGSGDWHPLYIEADGTVIVLTEGGAS